jgi:hypothetical protein
VLTANRAAAAEVGAAWPQLNDRIGLVPGKELLSALNRMLQPLGFTLSSQSLLNSMKPSDIPHELSAFLKAVEARLTTPGTPRLGA